MNESFCEISIRNMWKCIVLHYDCDIAAFYLNRIWDLGSHNVWIAIVKVFLWDGTHWANFNEKVHKPQIKSYGSLCANMQSFLCVSASQLFGLLGTFYITKYCIQNFIILIILLLSCIWDFCQKIPSSQVSNLIPTTESTYCREFGILSCFKAA